jgi:N-acetylglucosamine kinase-like BadF-type ATPase
MSYAPSPLGPSGSPEPLPPGIPDTLPGRLLGIDAGGSSTRVVLLAEGKLNRRPTAAAMNALITPDFTGKLLSLIRPSGATAAAMGVPGLRSPADAAELGRKLSDLAGIPVRMTGDGETATIGAFGGQPGIAVFAGTGSGAMGWDGTRWARAGGHGFLLGDEGSAYWLGKQAIGAALRWEDGRGGTEKIHDAVVDAAGCAPDELVTRVHSSPAERPLVTVFAPVLTSLAAEDEVAASIADEAARHLAELAFALRRRLGPLPVCGMGGVLSAPVIWNRFAELTSAVRPLASAEVGAALMAGGILERNEGQG